MNVCMYLCMYGVTSEALVMSGRCMKQGCRRLKVITNGSAKFKFACLPYCFRHVHRYRDPGVDREYDLGKNHEILLIYPLYYPPQDGCRCIYCSNRFSPDCKSRAGKSIRGSERSANSSLLSKPSFLPPMLTAAA